ncbi:hypothetical protein K3495_g5144 [Podosphaera aphanis]|nr:hypothetical protein K3495_g5144 [Podosphaera aphanis]
MAAIDTPWVMSFTPGSTEREDDWRTENNTPTIAAFSPLTASNASAKQHSPVLVNQKTSLLLATPPRVTRALAYSHPFLMPLNKLVGLITWSSGDPWESFLLVSAFWGSLLYGDQIIRYAGPLLFIISLLLASHFRRCSPLSSSGWNNEKQPKKRPIKHDSGVTTAKHQKTLEEIVETLRIFGSRCYLLFDPLFTLLEFLSTQTMATATTTNRRFMSLLIIRILLITPLWILLSLGPIQIITTRRIFLLLGTLFLTWHSKPVRITRMILWRSVLIRRISSMVTGLQFHPLHSGSTEQSHSTNPSHSLEKKNSIDLVPSVSSRSLGPQNSHNAPGFRFTFSLYENQRRWIGLGWTTNLFSYERAPWTDENQCPTLPKDDFKLPETNDKTTAWRWVKGSRWLVEGAEETDEGGVQASYGADGGMGWIYYDNKWEQGRRGLDGWSRFTRCREWYRDAELVETNDNESTPALTPSKKNANSLFSAIKSAMPYSISAPSISPPGITPTDAMSVQSDVQRPDSRDTSSINSWNSSHLGSVSCKDGLKQRSISRSCTSGITTDCGGGVCIKASPGSACRLLRREIGASRRSSMSVQSSVHSSHWSDDGLTVKRPRDGDWGIGDDARMGIE